jgi:methionine-rich copper-binding protein CopC
MEQLPDTYVDQNKLELNRPCKQNLKSLVVDYASANRVRKHLDVVEQVANQPVMLITSRVLLFFFGVALLFFGGVNMLAPRARFVSSSPPAGATVADPPAKVFVNFNNKLSTESTIDVVSTIRLSPSGDVEYLDGSSVMVSSALNTEDPTGKSMRADLKPGLHHGLYFIHWRTKSAGWGFISYGKTHFAVGMPVPEHIKRDGATWEQGYGYRGHRAALIGGMLMIALGFVLPKLKGR